MFVASYKFFFHVLSSPLHCIRDVNCSCPASLHAQDTTRQRCTEQPTLRSCLFPKIKYVFISKRLLESSSPQCFLAYLRNNHHQTAALAPINFCLHVHQKREDVKHIHWWCYSLLHWCKSQEKNFWLSNR